MQMQRIAWTVLGFALLANAGCQRPVLGYYETQGERDIEFARRDDKPILMNVVRPVGLEGRRPLVLWLHGGGWAAGSRSGLQAMAETCAAFGYVSATADYRLTIDAYRFPTQLEDVAAALTFLEDNAERFGIDPGRVIVGGDSAGGHLALLLGMCRKPELLGVESAKAKSFNIRGIVNIYGPTDMTALAAIKPANPITRPLLDALMGQQVAEAPQRWKDASPVEYVSKSCPPILTIHGDLDSIVPYSQATELDERCKAVGQPHRLIRVRGANHGWIMFSKGNTVKAVMPAIMHFIAEQTADCTTSPTESKDG
ncbi:MAG: alpha/beta hydrolase [Phycisphaerales bacterium]|nr:alpha/beta hydrolase [Phycisphaerales bacterium]MCB9854072.1 alpha/beta hydrolase [Phycisphaerales bacterium]MCB9864382.1 alpha/beta hydrolase [Phycisphaerales bacterium]